MKSEDENILRKCLVKAAELNSDFSILKDEIYMNNFFDDYKKSYPTIFTDELIALYLDRVCGNKNCNSIDDVIGILTNVDDESSLRNILQKIENHNGRDFMDDPDMMKVLLKDYDAILKPIYGVEIIDKIVAAMHSNQYSPSISYKEFESFVLNYDKKMENDIECSKTESNEKLISKKEIKTPKKITSEKRPTKEEKKSQDIHSDGKYTDYLYVPVPKAYVNNHTRFEKARIIGARALQISYGAPVLIQYPDDILDPIDIAIMEYDAGLTPITVQRS